MLAVNALVARGDAKWTPPNERGPPRGMAREGRIPCTGGTARPGLCVAFASRPADPADAEPFRDLTFPGLAGLEGPARPDVPETSGC